MTMLNNSAIIEKLSEEQKLALVTDIASAAQSDLNALGVPHAEKSDLDALNRNCCNGAYPNLGSVAHSWNAKLAENVVSDIVRRNGASSVNIVSTPDMGVKCSPYAHGFSEDPYLCAKIGNSMVAAVEKEGGAAVIGDFGLTNADIEYLDRTPDKGVISNILARPFDAVMKGRLASAVGVSFAKLNGEWKDINTVVAKDALNKNYVKKVIACDVYEEALRAGLKESALVFAGAPVSAVRAALRNYKRMKEDVERGSVTVGELETALASGTAISDELLDTAVDKVIDFLRSVVRERSSYGGAAGSPESVSARVSDKTESDDKIENDSAEEAIDNDNAADSPAAEQKAEPLRQAIKPQGDTAGAETGKQLSLLAAEESTVLLKNAGGVLPIVQAVKIAAVGELTDAFPDFDETANKICTLRGATFIGKEQGYSLDSERSDDLLGAAIGLAEKADVVLAFIGLGARREKNAYESKTVKLPANQIAMLDKLSKTGKTVIAVVTGNILPDMDFDVYASGILYAPAYGARVAESLFDILFGIVCPSGKLAFTAYGNVDESFARQKNDVALGRYKVGEFIGYRRYTSQNDKIRYPFGFGLSYTKFEYGNLKITASGVEISVRNIGGRAAFEVAQLYVGKSDSAIVRPARELKGFAKVMVAPNSTVKITFPLTAAMLEVYDSKSGTRKTEDGKYQIYVGASCEDIRLSGEMNISGVMLAKSESSLSDYLPTLTNITSGGYKLDAPKNTHDGFTSASAASGEYEYERLFIDEFGVDDIDGDEQEANGDNDDITLFLDDSVTVSTVTDGLIRYALAKGVKLDVNCARDIVAAFYASRAVILRCGEQEFDTLVKIISGYFGCPEYIDNAGNYGSSDDLFVYGSDTALAAAVGYAASHRERVTVVALDNFVAERTGAVFAPFIRYATAPDNMTVTVGSSRRTFEISPNMWFVMRLDDGNKVFPRYLADMATVVIPSFEGAAAVAESVTPPNYYQFVAAGQKAEREYELDEIYWKKADRLEEYVDKRTPFKLGNKLCVQMEKYIAVILACGGESSDALDRVAAAKLIPYIAYALDGKLTADDDDFSQTLDNIFGDGEAAQCKKAVKRAKV